MLHSRSIDEHVDVVITIKDAARAPSTDLAHHIHGGAKGKGQVQIRDSESGGSSR
jgi:hypothetical protein